MPCAARNLYPARPTHTLHPPLPSPTTLSESLSELTERVRTAVALPVRIDIKDAFDASVTELTVTANIDSGGRGRPRVTFDVTQGLSAAGVGIFMADGEAAWGVGGGGGGSVWAGNGVARGGVSVGGQCTFYASHC